MRKLILLLLLAAVAYIAIHRQRLFLRDPMGKVLVGGVAVEEATVLINYSNDVLILKDNRSPVLVQRWDRMPGHPERLSCFRTMVCLSSDDHAPKVTLKGSEYDPGTVMGDREVSYRDPAGVPVRVIIR